MREECPHCGAELPPGVRACPECGSDEQTGWAEDATTSGLGLPEDDFNYDQFVKTEFAVKSPVPRGLHWFWWLVAVALLVSLVVFWLRR